MIDSVFYRIEIVRIHDGIPAPIEELHLNSTQDDTTLYAMGLRVDNSSWIPLSVNWGIDTPATENIPPYANSQWYLSPRFYTSGKIYCTYYDSSSPGAYFDTIHFTFGNTEIIPSAYFKKEQIKIVRNNYGMGNTIQLQFSDPVNNTAVSLISCTGRTIAQVKGSGSRHLTLPVKHKAKGTYFIQVLNDKLNQIYKIILLN